MQPESFLGYNDLIAKNQQEYATLPVYRVPEDTFGRVTCCWKLDFAERLKLLFTGKVWHTVMTFNRPLQPQLLEVDRPEYIPHVHES